jgi:hypothetical protein
MAHMMKTCYTFMLHPHAIGLYISSIWFAKVVFDVSAKLWTHTPPSFRARPSSTFDSTNDNNLQSHLLRRAGFRNGMQGSGRYETKE